MMWVGKKKAPAPPVTVEPGDRFADAAGHREYVVRRVEGRVVEYWDCCPEEGTGGSAILRRSSLLQWEHDLEVGALLRLVRK